MSRPRPRARLAGALVAAAAAMACLTAVVGAAPPLPPFRATVRPLSGAERAAMTPSVWRPGCPVGLSQLRRVTVRVVGFGGRASTGAVVVHVSVARQVVGVFRALYRARFPIRRMTPIERYGGSDFASIEADNTSAFNCRRVDGSPSWSEHAFGRAIDVNPIENPYVSGGRTSHPASVPYLDRSRVRPGMAVEGGALVRAFGAAGWGWGGRWSPARDLQHFSADGR